MDLLDRIWRDLNNTRIWKKAPKLAKDIYRDHYAVYRRILPQARAFDISEAAMAVAFELSLEGPEKVAQRLFMARLPFPKVWIEFDFHHKTRLGFQAGVGSDVDDDTPARIGWLFQEDSSDPLRWSMTTWVSVNDEKPAHIPHRGEMLSSPSMACWMVDTANRAPPERMGNVNGVTEDFIGDVVKVSDVAKAKHPNDAWRAFAHLGWGYTAANMGVSGNPTVDPMRQLTIPDHLKNSINLGWEPMSYQIKEVSDPVEIKRQFIDSAVEARGDVRLAVALLSLINEVPIIETPRQTKGAFTGAGGGIRHYLSKNMVTINIPSRRPIGQIRKMFSKKIKTHKARHEVRGHYRTIIHKNDHPRKVTHPDGRIEEIFFAKGQLERVWVNNHERGDEAYGRVVHSYQVEKSGKSGSAAKPGKAHLPAHTQLPTGRSD